MKIDNINRKKYTFKSLICDFLTIIVLAGVMSAVILHFGTFATVDGHSMDNTLADRQKLIIAKTVYDSINDVERGDIVVAKEHIDDNEFIIKRIIGLPGDHIQIKNNTAGISILYINGKAQKENYIKENMYSPEIDITVGTNQLFLMGDNRNNSLDSRYSIIGNVDFDKIVGKAIFNVSTISKL